MASGLLFGQQGIHQRLVADIAVDEAIARIVFDGSQILQIAGVSQLIQIDYAHIGLRQWPCGRKPSR